MVRCLKFRICEGEGLYYLCSENKGADQLCRYWAGDLCLCFRDVAHIYCIDYLFPMKSASFSVIERSLFQCTCSNFNSNIRLEQKHTLQILSGLNLNCKML